MHWASISDGECANLHTAGSDGPMSDIETSGPDQDDPPIHDEDPVEGPVTSDPGGDSDPDASTAEDP